MATHALTIRHDPPNHDGLHPFVYRSIVALTIWLVLSVWAFFGTGAYVGLIFAVVTLFFLIALAIPILIWLTWTRNTSEAEQGVIRESFAAWGACEFATWTGRVSGMEAATQILLPIAAVSIGMTVFGLVFYLSVPQTGY